MIIKLSLRNVMLLYLKQIIRKRGTPLILSLRFIIGSLYIYQFYHLAISTIIIIQCNNTYISQVYITQLVLLISYTYCLLAIGLSNLMCSKYRRCSKSADIHNTYIPTHFVANKLVLIYVVDQVFCFSHYMTYVITQCKSVRVLRCYRYLLNYLNRMYYFTTYV